MDLYDLKFSAENPHSSPMMFCCINPKVNCVKKMSLCVYVSRLLLHIYFMYDMHEFFSYLCFSKRPRTTHLNIVQRKVLCRLVTR